MRKNALIWFGKVGLPALMVLIAGCESSRVNLARSGVVRLEPCTEGKVRVVWSEAYTDGKGFTVAGVVRRADTTGVPIPVNVQVTVLAPDGRRWGAATSHELYVPRRMVSRAQGFERFRVHFPGLPPEGSSIRIAPCDAVSRKTSAIKPASTGLLSTGITRFGHTIGSLLGRRGDGLGAVSGLPWVSPPSSPSESHT